MAANGERRGATERGDSGPEPDPEDLAGELAPALVESGLTGPALTALLRAIDGGGRSRYWRRKTELSGWLFDLLDGPTGPRARAFAREALWTMHGGDLAVLLARIDPVQLPELPAILENRDDLGPRAADACRRLADWAARDRAGAKETLAAVARVAPETLVAAVSGSRPAAQAELLRIWRTLPELRRHWPREWVELLSSPLAAVRWLSVVLLPREQVTGRLAKALAKLAESDPAPEVRKLAALYRKSQAAGTEPLWPTEPVWPRGEEDPEEVEVKETSPTGKGFIGRLNGRRA